RKARAEVAHFAAAHLLGLLDVRPQVRTRGFGLFFFFAVHFFERDFFGFRPRFRFLALLDRLGRWVIAAVLAFEGLRLVDRRQVVVADAARHPRDRGVHDRAQFAARVEVGVVAAEAVFVAGGLPLFFFFFFFGAHVVRAVSGSSVQADGDAGRRQHVVHRAGP